MNNQNMPEISPEVDPLTQYREEFMAARARSVEIYSQALRVQIAAKAGLDFFELGLKLGKGQNPETLVTEIRDYLTRREQQLAEMLFPERRNK